jgi:hypothetical protein
VLIDGSGLTPSVIGILFVACINMRKALVTAAFVFCTMFTLHAQAPVVTQIELTKQSRGYQEAIRITADSVFVVAEDLKNSKPALRYAREISDEDWTSLLSTIGSIKLKDIESLSSPTMKRASDAAMHAILKITTNDGSEYAHGYDDENPHESLQELRKKVREVSGKDE